MLFKRFLIWSSGDPPVQWSETIYAILKEGIMGNIHVKLYEIRTSGSGGDVVETKSLRTDARRTTDKDRSQYLNLSSGELKTSDFFFFLWRKPTYSLGLDLFS